MNDSESKTIKWENELSDLSNVIDNLESNVNDLVQVKRLRDIALQIFEIVERELEEFQCELNRVIAEHEEFIQINEHFIPIKHQFTKEDTFQVFSSDWRSILATVNHSIAHCEKIDLEINEIYPQFSKSNIETQKILVRKIDDLIKEKQRHWDILKVNVSSLFLDGSNDDFKTDYDKVQTVKVSDQSTFPSKGGLLYGYGYSDTIGRIGRMLMI